MSSQEELTQLGNQDATSRSLTGRVSESITQANIPEPTNVNAAFVYNFYMPDEMNNREGVSVQDPQNPASTLTANYVGTGTHLASPMSRTYEKSVQYYKTQRERFPMYVTCAWDEVSFDDTFVDPIPDDVLFEITSTLETYLPLAETEESFANTRYTGLFLTAAEVYATFSSLMAHMPIADMGIYEAASFADTSMWDLEEAMTEEFTSSLATSIRSEDQARAAISTVLAELGMLAGGSTGGLVAAAANSSMDLDEMLGEMINTFNDYQTTGYMVLGVGIEENPSHYEDHAGRPTTGIVSDSQISEFFKSVNRVTFGGSIFNPIYSIAVFNASQDSGGLNLNQIESSVSYAEEVSTEDTLPHSGVTADHAVPVVNPVTIVVSDVDAIPELGGLDARTSFTAGLSTKMEMSVVGYSVVKEGITAGGDPSVYRSSLVSPYSNGNEVADSAIAYGDAVRYHVRTCACAGIPAINRSLLGSQDDQYFTAYVLMLSRPVGSNVVRAVDETPPPPPQNLSFYYDSEIDALVMTWEMPTNPQEDIVRFQVFRRTVTNEPFELLHMYDWDRSVTPYPESEVGINPELVTVSPLTGPTLRYVDLEWGKDSKLIYSLASLDARHMSSGYSAQFQVSFDRYKNELIVEYLSQSGAPKPYPNLYINVDKFKDVISTSGYDEMLLFFDPDYYEVKDGDNPLGLVAFSENGSIANYKMNILNTDMQQSRNIEIKMVDSTNLFKAFTGLDTRQT
jgi:hypothetical protein